MTVELGISVTMGMILGIFFYGSLWLTVQKLMFTRHSIALILGSILLRMTVVLGGMLLVARGKWQNVLACLIGLTIGKIVVTKYCQRWVA